MIPEFSALSDAPRSHKTDLLDYLRQDLKQVNYSTDRIVNLLGENAYSALSRDVLIPGIYQLHQIRLSPNTTPEEKNLATAVAIFLLGQTVAEETLSAAFPQLGITGLEELGLIEQHQKGLRARVDLRPHSADDGTELWVAADLGAHQRPGLLHKNHVLGIGHASRTLAQFTERTPVSRALDLGTGCGIQTFHLLAHAQHVTATDISDRALAFTRFNLLLNADSLGIDPNNMDARVSLRLGSLLEPVAREKFDLIVSNPPFVITPRHENESASEQYTYRDGGMAGDDIVSTLIKTLPTVLVEGGRAQMLGNWEIPAASIEEETDWSARIRTWVGEKNEAWLIQREVLSPEQYAETWLKDASENRDQDHYAKGYTDYLQDFSQRGVEAIGFGMIWLRKPTAQALAAQVAHPQKNILLQRFEEISYPIQQPLAPFISAAVKRHDRLAHTSDGELVAQHLLVAEDVTEERHSIPGAEHPSVIILRQGAGLRRTVVETSETSGFVGACDGELAAGQIINALAAILNWDELEANGSVNPKYALLGHIRELVRDGFLVPEEASID